MVTALSRRFGRFLATVTGTITDFAYGETWVSGGGAPVDGSEQDYREYAGDLRLDYEITDRLGVFAQAGINTRDYATDVSSGGLRLGSDGVSVLTPGRDVWHGWKAVGRGRDRLSAPVAG